MPDKAPKEIFVHPRGWSAKRRQDGGDMRYVRYDLADELLEAVRSCEDFCEIVEASPFWDEQTTNCIKPLHDKMKKALDYYKNA